MIQSFRRNPRLITRQVLFLQPPKISLRNSSHHTISSPNNSNKWKSAWKALVKASINWKKRMSETWELLLKGGAIFLVGDLIYLGWVNQTNERRVSKTLERGTQPEEAVLKDKLIPRPNVVERLKEIFQPDEDHSYYHVVCGEHGTGKTTLTKKVAREVGKGVIYVDAPSDIEEFGKSFGKAINFIFDEDAMLTLRLKRKFFGDTKNDLNPKWKRALSAFKDASEIYKAKHNKPPVIIYDNISQIINEEPKVLDFLQDDAKKNADNRKYVAVFVSSEGSVPRRMESRSAWSRAKKQVIEIGDLSEKESMEYLTKKREINEVEAKNLYELVGGRIVELKEVADDFLAGISFEAIKQSVFTKAEKKFKEAQLYEDQQLHEIGKNVINALLNSKVLSYLEYRRVFKSIEKAKEFDPDELLGKNVLAYHPATNTVTFQSQSIIRYILEKSKE